MKKNYFRLGTPQLKKVALELKSKIDKGLLEDNTEVQCLPTFIKPKNIEEISKGKALVLDLGGTNYRAAIVDFVNGEPEIHPENGWKKDLSVMKTPGFTQEQLFKEMADLISEIKTDVKLPIGYCFSYPAESLMDGDANLIRWTKGVNIDEMINKPIGKPLRDYLNKLKNNKFTEIKVINDTVASLFAALTEKGYDAQIGLIVGTGTNMATFVDTKKIKKLGTDCKIKGKIPINLESGNFYPSFLTPIDDKVDMYSDKKGAQRFEKAVSGMYLGEILRFAFPYDEFEKKFDAEKLTNMMSYPNAYKKKYVKVARDIYKRSAQLVAASIAGLVLVLASHEKSIKNIRLIAEGSLFWSEDKKGDNYKDIVEDELQKLLTEFDHKDIHVQIDKMGNANLIGSAIAALS